MTLSAPPPPPRTVSFGEFYGLLPGNLQIMALTLPFFVPAIALWLALSPAAFTPALATAIYTPIYLFLMLRHRHKLVHYPAVRGRVTDVKRGEAQFSGCKVVHYEYEVRGEHYADNFMTGNRRDLIVGMEIWILVDPLKPNKSLPWMS